MKGLFVITYVGNPKNFDIVRIDITAPPKNGFIEAEMLATSENNDGFHSDMPVKKFFTQEVWMKRAHPIKDLRPYSRLAKQKTKEFQKLLIQGSSKKAEDKTTRKVNWR